LEQLLEKYPEDVRFVYRHFPLISIHDKAALATQASEAAGKQGKFWEMHDLLLSKQSDWSELDVAGFQTWLLTEAESLKLDVPKFKTDLNSPELVDLAQNAWDDNGAKGLGGTPTLVMNGLPLTNFPLDFYSLSTLIELMKLEKSQFPTCPEMGIDPTKQYVASIKTEKGDIVLELFPDKAPLAVNNFVFLARHGWYDNTTFHRVLPDFMAQGGDPSGTGYGGPGYVFDNETSPDLTFDREGLLAMANSGPDSNGSQFFITYGPAEQLNGGYTIFGQVISGMDVVKAITPRDPSQSADLPPGDKILSITVEEK
jgi:cyclophilin family peptidyl-prolyl cis-trans isomerase